MICQCMRRSWEHGTKDKVLNFESAIMCTNNVVVNVVVMNLRINYECRGFDFINSLIALTPLQPVGV